MIAEWVLRGRQSECAVVATVEAAVEAIDSAVRAAYGATDTTALAHSLWAVVGPLRAVMVTEGAAAIARGESWSYRGGEISVVLYPT